MADVSLIKIIPANKKIEASAFYFNFFLFDHLFNIGKVRHTILAYRKKIPFHIKQNAI